MGATKKLTIVSSNRVLNGYPILNMDNQVFELFHQSIPCADPAKLNLPRILTNLLDCYLGVTGQSLTFLSLSRKSTNTVFAGFVGALWNDAFIDASPISRSSYVRGFLKGLKAMSDETPSIACEIDKNAAKKLWGGLKLCDTKIEYYRGWLVPGKPGTIQVDSYVSLAWVWNNLGPDVARNIHKSASEFLRGYSSQSAGNFLPTLNEFCRYIETKRPEICEANLADPLYTTQLIEEFCSAYFNDKASNNYCIETSIKRWNDAIGFIEATLIKSGVFAKPYRSIPYVPPKRKHGSESKVSVSENGVAVKDNILTEIPLDVTDDDAMGILFHAIDADHKAALIWAEKQAENLYSRCVASKGVFDYMDFDLVGKEYNTKYKISARKGEKITDFAYKIGMPSSYALEPHFYLLINEEPKITESYLISVELFDKHGKFCGIEETDGGQYLVGYKKRKGGKRAQQKVLLNDKAKTLVEEIIEITEPLRSYLKAKSDDAYRYLCLSSVTGFSYPRRIIFTLKTNQTKEENAAIERRVSQFVDLSKDNWGLEKCDLGAWDSGQAERFVRRLTPTKFRATCGVRVFLETGSARAMSEALGHEKYKSDLLTHYLPEPILRYFQARWIKIFQKGIVCEAMKDSQHLLRASGFKSMKELERFLLNHTISLPKDEDKEERQEEPEQVYISVDKNVLTALLSIEKAVDAATKKVNAKASYWAKFAARLATEIETNSYDKDMMSALEYAKSNADASLMEGLIYV